jgi:hypothetical protein
MVLLALVGLSCSGRPFKAKRVDPEEGRPNRAGRPENLQKETVQTLRQLDLLDRMGDSPLAVAAILKEDGWGGSRLVRELSGTLVVER